MPLFFIRDLFYDSIWHNFVKLFLRLFFDNGRSRAQIY